MLWLNGGVAATRGLHSGLAYPLRVPAPTPLSETSSPEVRPETSATRAAGAARTGSPAHRLAALDGLRGVAAVIVVLHHTLAVAAPHLAPSSGPVQVGSAWWWLTETPFKVLTAGAEAVVLFFVLSGLVVALPALRGGFSWAGFLTSRFVRIMLPVWGSIVVAAVLLLLVPRSTGGFAAGSWLVDNNATAPTVAELVREAMLSRYSYEINNVLWSLRWEMLFAVLLPLFLLTARAARRVWLPVGLLALVASGVGFAIGDGSLSYLPAFFLGTLIAVNLDELRAWGTRVSAARWFRAGWPLTLAGALLVSVATWLARPALGTGVADETLRVGAVVGSVAIIVLAVVAAPVSRVLAGRVCAFLGRISFSVYLVHVPLLVAVAYLVGDANWTLAVLIGPPLGVLGGWLFWRLLERPVHVLARRAGHAVGAAVGKPAAESRGTSPESAPVRN
jgi:peptidoglycan/LPS O-acetylase OafA/YrhL